MKNPETISERIRLLDQLYLGWDHNLRKAQKARHGEHREHFGLLAVDYLEKYKRLVDSKIPTKLI